MSQRIELWELSHDDQDKLYIKNICPKCDAIIIDRVSTEDYESWLCNRCDRYFIVE